MKFDLIKTLDRAVKGGEGFITLTVHEADKKSMCKDLTNLGLEFVTMEYDDKVDITINLQDSYGSGEILIRLVR